MQKIQCTGCRKWMHESDNNRMICENKKCLWSDTSRSQKYKYGDGYDTFELYLDTNNGNEYFVKGLIYQNSSRRDFHVCNTDKDVWNLQSKLKPSMSQIACHVERHEVEGFMSAIRKIWDKDKHETYFHMLMDMYQGDCIPSEFKVNIRSVKDYANMWVSNGKPYVSWHRWWLDCYFRDNNLLVSEPPRVWHTGMWNNYVTVEYNNMKRVYNIYCDYAVNIDTEYDYGAEFYECDEKDITFIRKNETSNSDT